jgi:hypothetical protein
MFWIGIAAGLYRGLELSSAWIAARDKRGGEQQKEEELASHNAIFVPPAGQCLRRDGLVTPLPARPFLVFVKAT